MSLVVAVPAALAAAASFGAASAVQHSAAHAQTGGGAPAVRTLPQLVRNPRWLAGVSGDVAGMVLLIVALTTGPVSLVQPLQVLGLLVALPVSRALGGPNLTRREAGAAILVIAGLAGFLSLVANPGAGREPGAATLPVVSVLLLIVGGLALFLTRTRSPATRAVTFGTVSGGWFGLAAVLLRGVDLSWTRHGIRLLNRGAGVSMVVSLLVVGVLALVVTQLAFQIGPLASSLPAQIMSDPIVAVVLGVAVLHEHVPWSLGRAALYLGCTGAATLGIRNLAYAQFSGAGAV